MKTCPVCGLVLDESYLFCPEDGSALGDPGQSEPEAKVAAAITEEKSSAVVLYCPACAAEYPLTFSMCPVHAVPLTKHKIPAFVAPPAKPALDEEKPVAQAQIVDEAVDDRKSFSQEDISQDTLLQEGVLQEAAQPIQPDSSRALDYETARASMSRPRRKFRFRPSAEVERYALTGLKQPALRQEHGAEQIESSSIENSPDEARLLNAAGEASSDGRGLRNAAVAVAVCLFILAIVGLTSLYKSITRRPNAAAAKTASPLKEAAQQPAVVYTPQAALDYKEEKPEPQKQEVESPAEDKRAIAEDRRASAEDRRAGKEDARDVAAVPSTILSKRDSLAQQKSVVALKEQAPPPRPVFAAKPSPASELVLPRGTFGQVEARLVQVRARKTSAGVRYDLTFNMQEQAGRATQWERLAIQTRSASGISQSQTMPFYHRLGATGTLTFTVSVEMQGRAQPDWQGRVICTSIGTDQTGRSYRASFGANVSPN